MILLAYFLSKTTKKELLFHQILVVLSMSSVGFIVINQMVEYFLRVDYLYRKPYFQPLGSM
ncbi:MAG: hypothetical protein A6F72_01970 [Cycloclasticus sp. symbiont of Poecilosclerida sp. N]|nr:MAG: hypothetical protein A6F72_01970 [Cycloclasticus sp. symbiont of Poecilosclerida sp. N]